MHTILITGANRGLGLEMVKQYSIEGWQVLACCREPEKADELQKLKQNKNIKILQLDVSNTQSIKNLLLQIENQSIDILLNNAGIFPQNLEFGKADPEALIDAFKVNTVAPFILAETLFKNIAASTFKIIANISSIMGSVELNSDGGYYAYRSTKAALNAITKSMAVDLKKHEVKVVALHPGWVQTDMGGSNATVTPAESVKKIRKILSNLTWRENGGFIGYDSNRLAW